jgi:hypothetical protein
MHISQSQRIPRWLWWLAGGLVLGVVACVAAGALALGWADGILGSTQENLTQAQIESIGRIKLPPSAANLHAVAGGFQDRFILVRFDIDRADLPALAGSRYWPSLDSTGAVGVPFQPGLEPDRPWWKPREAQRFASGSNVVDGIAQAVLVDMTDANRYIVYIQTFET